MYYEHLQTALGERFEAIFSSVEMNRGDTLNNLADYFDFLLLEDFFRDFLKRELIGLEKYSFDPHGFHPIVFFSVAYFCRYTSLSSDQNRIEALKLNGCALHQWMIPTTILFFQGFSQLDWRQELLGDRRAASLRSFHDRLKLFISDHQGREGLFAKETGDRTLCKHILLREGGKYPYLLLRQVKPLLFLKKERISPLARNLILHLEGSRGTVPLPVLVEKLLGKKESYSNEKSKINTLCKEAGLTDLIMNNDGYFLNPNVEIVPDHQNSDDVDEVKLLA
jgi:hypothetical protein